LLVTRGLRGDDRGRHATTRRQLLLLPTGAAVIDTPGMRELGLAAADLHSSFADIEALAAQCRFRDCTHTAEPGCAVRQAIAQGLLDEDRLESLTKLQREMAFAQRKGTMTAAQRERQKTVDMVGSLDALHKWQKTNRKK
jgi:ribosome biogenesis GTPase